MKNNTVNDQNGWKPVYRYDLNSNNKNVILVNLPEEYKDYKNCCFMLETDDGKGAFTKPFTYNEETNAWCPSRTATEDNVIAYGNTEGPTKYTTQNISEEEKASTAAKKKTTTNSASSLFCTAGAFVVLATAFIM